MGTPDVGRFFLEKIRNISPRADCRARHRRACGRRFAAEVGVMPEDAPPVGFAVARRFISGFEDGEGFLTRALHEEKHASFAVHAPQDGFKILLAENGSAACLGDDVPAL